MQTTDNAVKSMEKKKSVYINSQRKFFTTGKTLNTEYRIKNSEKVAFSDNIA